MRERVIRLALICATCLGTFTGNSIADTGYLHQGSLMSWGLNQRGQTNAPAGNTYTQVTVDYNHNFALRSDGSLVGWGADNYRQQTRIPAGNGFVQVEAGNSFALALKADGTLVGWGANTYDQQNPPAAQTFDMISAGGGHSLGLTPSGSLVGWGLNNNGQADVPTGNGFTRVDAGQFHSLTLDDTGSAAGWGRNFTGQTDVPPENHLVQVAAGYLHSLALQADGGLVGWGDNSNGQGQVPTGNDFTKIGVGFHHSLAIKQDGSLVAWGYNNSGQTDVPTEGYFLQVGGGYDHSTALRARGNYQNLLVKDVDRFTLDDTLLQRFVEVAGNVTIDSDMDWQASSGFLHVSGQLNILPGSELRVFLGSVEPTLGQSFQLFDAPQLAIGEFADLHLPPLDPGLFWSADHLYDSGILVVVPEPASVLLLSLGCTSLIRDRRLRTA